MKQEDKKQVTMGYDVHENLVNEIDELKSHIHQCETDGKYKVITIKTYLTTTCVGMWGSAENSWDKEVESLMSLDELEAAKLESTEQIVRDVAKRQKKLDDQTDKLETKDEMIDVLMKSKELLDEVREMNFFSRIKFIFAGIK